MEQYEIIKELGSGAFGKVYKCKHIESASVFAVKRITGQKFETWAECLKLREVCALKKLGKHSHIVNLRQVIRQEKSLYLVFDFHPGNLHRIIERSAVIGIPLYQVRAWTFQLFSALDHMHTHGYFHRDLKPENLLLDTSGNLVVCDFGCAREVRSRPPFTTYVSTRWYRAPELVLHQNSYNSPVDIWAAGCVLAELFLFKPLFPGKSTADQLHKIEKLCGKVPKSKCFPQTVRKSNSLASSSSFGSSDSKHVPQPCGISPLQRLLNQHNIDESAIELIVKLLALNPDRRPNAKACVSSSFLRNHECQRNASQSGASIDLPGGSTGVNPAVVSTSGSASPEEPENRMLHRRSSSNSRLDQLALEAEELLAASPHKRKLSFEWDDVKDVSSHEIKSTDYDLMPQETKTNDSQTEDEIRIQLPSKGEETNKAAVAAEYLARLDDDDSDEDDDCVLNPPGSSSQLRDEPLRREQEDKTPLKAPPILGKPKLVSSQTIEQIQPSDLQEVNDNATEMWGSSKIGQMKINQEGRILFKNTVSAIETDDLGLEDVDDLESPTAMKHGSSPPPPVATPGSHVSCNISSREEAIGSQESEDDETTPIRKTSGSVAVAPKKDSIEEVVVSSTDLHNDPHQVPMHVKESKQSDMKATKPFVMYSQDQETPLATTSSLPFGPGSNLFIPISDIGNQRTPKPRNTQIPPPLSPPPQRYSGARKGSTVLSQPIPGSKKAKAVLAMSPEKTTGQTAVQSNDGHQLEVQKYKQKMQELQDIIAKRDAELAELKMLVARLSQT